MTETPNQTDSIESPKTELTKPELVKWVRNTLFVALALVTAEAGISTIRNYQMRSELLAANPHAVVDSQTGNVLCGHNGKAKLDEKIISGVICGKRVRLKESVFKKFERASEEMANDYKKNPKPGKDSWKYECIRICESFRTNAYQKAIRDNLGYTSNDQPSGYSGLSPAAPPCYSMHEPAQAGDVRNWYQAQPYLEKQGLVGGTRGIYRDPWHYSRGEMSEGGYAGAGMQMLWWGKYKLTHDPDDCP